MIEVIDKYEDDLRANIQTVTTRIQAQINSKEEWKEIRALMSQCEKGIKLIETELVGQSPRFRSEKNSQLRGYKKKLQNVKKIAFDKENNWELQMGKRDIFGRSSEFINQYDKSTEATQRLRQSVKVMYETESISDNVNNELVSHSARLVSNKTKLQQIRHDLTKSERKIKSMMLRIRKNKFIVRGVIAFIIVLFLIVIVSYFR